MMRYDLDQLKMNTLTATTAVTLGEDAAAKTRLFRLIIRKNAVAVTADVAGFGNESDAAKTLQFTGLTTADTVIEFGGARATVGALKVTASVADKVDVIWGSA
jgi:hypothetical protein